MVALDVYPVFSRVRIMRCLHRVIIHPIMLPGGPGRADPGIVSLGIGIGLVLIFDLIDLLTVIVEPWGV